jgi:hypothetical protein
MKSCATGLIVRFFRVMIPICMSAIGGSTGRTLISGCLVGNLYTDAWNIVMKRPAATSLIRAWALSLTIVVRG